MYVMPLAVYFHITTSTFCSNSFLPYLPEVQNLLFSVYRQKAQACGCYTPKSVVKPGMVLASVKCNNRKIHIVYYGSNCQIHIVILNNIKSGIRLFSITLQLYKYKMHSTYICIITQLVQSCCIHWLRVECTSCSYGWWTKHWSLYFILLHLVRSASCCHSKII